MNTMCPSFPSLLLSCVIVLLSACATHTPAPVIDRAPPQTLPGEARDDATSSMPPAPALLGPGMVMVKKGDTLRAIALDHGQSYRDLAAWNNLSDPDKINVGQVLRVIPPESAAPEAVAISKPVTLGVLSSPSATIPPVPSPANQEGVKQSPRGGKQPYSPEALARLQAAEAATTTVTTATAASTAIAATPENKPLETSAKPTEKTPTPTATSPAAAASDEALAWSWPLSGKMLASFVEGSNKGVDIAGKSGDPVLAAAGGKVILVSNALRGYGNFVIIKHNNQFLSVYAHNSRILVKEEQNVSKGQKIAEVGNSDTDQPKLHFEIRRQGKPVDPLKFLPAR